MTFAWWNQSWVPAPEEDLREVELYADAWPADVEMLDEPDEMPEIDRMVVGRTLVAALDTIAPRLRDLVLLRYGLELTLAEVGDAFGVSRERVRQLEVTALRLLRRKREVIDLVRETPPIRRVRLAPAAPAPPTAIVIPRRGGKKLPKRAPRPWAERRRHADAVIAAYLAARRVA